MLHKDATASTPTQCGNIKRQIPSVICLFVPVARFALFKQDCSFRVCFYVIHIHSNMPGWGDGGSSRVKRSDDT